MYSEERRRFHLKRLGIELPKGYVGRRVVCEILGRSGVRASELCELRIGEVRLHDPNGARFRIPDAKTDTGIREVQMSPDLVEAIVEHLDWLERTGAPVGADAYLVSNVRGGRLSRQRVAEIVGQAAAFATKRLQGGGLPQLPRTTPHSLRRTYISIALLANNFDVKWVMSQVGHADSKMTLDVYAQLEQRVQRDHGVGFDRLVRDARVQLHGTDTSMSTERVLAPKWPWRARATPSTGSKPEPEREEPHDLQGSSEVARPGLEPGTPRFSGE